MNREESSRVYKEFEKFYAKFPQYKAQANHGIFLHAAEQDGGSEVLTAEWLELQLDSLRSQLAVLQHTPDQALNKFMAEHRALDCTANRQLISEHIQKHYGTVEQAVSALSGQLSFNQEVANEESRRRQEQHRAYLVNEASSSELKAIARHEAEERRRDFVIQEDQRQLQAMAQRDEAHGFDVLPATNQISGETLDNKFFIRLSNTDVPRFKSYIKRYGAFQITQRIRGQA